MTKLIIDAAKDDMFFMIITKNYNYSITHENTKVNFEKIIMLINDFLSSKNLKIADVSRIYVNRGPGSFAGIRSSLSIVKGIHLSRNIDYFCFSYFDFLDKKPKNIKDLLKKNIVKMPKWIEIPNLCNKYKIKKNLIKPLYVS